MLRDLASSLNKKASLSFLSGRGAPLMERMRKRLASFVGFGYL
jgi:hypothetical protein